MISITEIAAALSKNLSRSRFEHSVAVASLARALARKHGEDQDEAYRAGLIHDCAKEWSPGELYRYVTRHKIDVPDKQFISRNAPGMFHAYVGAAYAHNQGWITKKKSLRAIASHTLGNLSMNDFDRIIYIADFAAKDRKFSSAGAVRRTAMDNLEQGFVMAIAKKIEWHLLVRKPIHPFALKVWNVVSSRD